MDRPVPTSGALGLSLPEALNTKHDISCFDCGKPSLNEWLHRHALASAAGLGTRTFVTHRSGVVLGYYTLCNGAVDIADVPVRIAKGQGKYPIPVTVLARLAVDESVKGQGVGASLLQDAMAKYVQIVNLTGSRAILVHAMDDAAAGFYSKYDFEPSPLSPLHLYLLGKDVIAAVDYFGR